MGYIYEINVNVTMFLSICSHKLKKEQRESEWDVWGTLSSLEVSCHSNKHPHIFEWILTTTYVYKKGIFAHYQK